jgi:hypothetical protein
MEVGASTSTEVIILEAHLRLGEQTRRRIWQDPWALPLPLASKP